MSQSLPVPENSLGLTQSELVILRQTTEVALRTRSQGSAMPERGRGNSRHSQPSSRAASASSNQSMQRVTLDSNSIGRVEQALDNMMRGIQARIQEVSANRLVWFMFYWRILQLEQILAQSVQDDRDGVTRSVAQMDRELERSRKALSELDQLDTKLESIKRICKVVRGLRQQCDVASARLDKVVTLQIVPQPPTARARWFRCTSFL